MVIKIVIWKLPILILAFKVSMDRLLQQLITNAIIVCSLFDNIKGVFRTQSSIEDEAFCEIVNLIKYFFAK